MSELKRRLRERSEHYLLQESVQRLGRGMPGTVKPYRGNDGLFWRFVFVPLYRRLPWSVKKQAMERLRMTAQGWTPPPLEPRTPWTPPERG